MKRKFFKHIVVCSSIMAILGTCSYLPYFNQKKHVRAVTENSFVNGNFTSSSSESSKPFKPSNFTQVGAQNQNIKAGIIYLDNTNYDKYKEDYGLTGSYTNYYDAGVSSDSKTLLINNVNTDLPVSSGFKSDSFTLNANKFYKLSLYARTVNNGRGVIILQGNKNQTAKALYSTHKVLSGAWDIYTFYIETNKNISTSATLSLWLGDSETSGSVGGVLFDTITLTEISETNYNAHKNNSSLSSNAQVISLTNNVNKLDNFIKNANFETTSTSGNGVFDGWTRSQLGEYTLAEIVNLQNAFGDNIKPGDYKKSQNTNHGFFLYSKENVYETFTSDEFIIKQNDRIEIDFYAKKSDDATASARLYTTGFEKNGITVEYKDQSYNGSINISTTDNANTNNYGLFKLIINGNYYYDTRVKLELNLGSESSKTSGYVIFDDINVYRLNNELYKANEGGSNSTTINLYTGSTSSSTVTNGYFNFADSIEFDENYNNVIFPIANVTGFDKATSSETNSVSGIIDVNENQFNINKSKYGAITNPRSPDLLNNAASGTSTNNILLLRNKTNGYTTFTSTDTKTLSKNSYAKISVDAYRDTDGASGKAYLKVLDSNGNEIASLDITEKSWQKKEIYLYSGLIDSTSLKVALCLGDKNNEASGNVYFDNVSYDTPKEEEFNSALNSSDKNTLAIDISKITFDNATTPLENHNNMYVSNEFALSEDSNASTVLGVYKNSPVGNSGNNLNSILCLTNTQEGYSSATSNKGFSVEANSYYKIVVNAKISDITSSNQSDENYGAFIKLQQYTSNQNQHINLKDTVNNNNESIFKKFEFVIRPTENETLNVVFGLGNNAENNKVNVAGNIYVDKIEIQSITSNEFDSYDTNSLENNVVGVKIGTHDAENTDGNTESPKAPFKFNWWYFSSIVMALTLFIVIAALLIKKVNWKKVFKKDTTTLADYDTRRIEHEQKILTKKEMRARKRAFKNKNKK